jgi:hypothetical protein
VGVYVRVGGRAELVGVRVNVDVGRGVLEAVAVRVEVGGRAVFVEYGVGGGRRFSGVGRGA